MENMENNIPDSLSSIEQNLHSFLTKRNILFFSVAVVLILTFLFFGFFKNGINKISGNNLKDGWKVYRDDTLGIEFSYPNKWGDPISSDISTLKSRLYDIKKNPNYISIYFKSTNFVTLTFFNDKFLENSPNDWSRYDEGYMLSDWPYYEGNIEVLNQTGNICDYHIGRDYTNYDYNTKSPGTLTEIGNNCKNGIKETVVEKKQGEGLYLYNLNYFAFKKANNPLFKNVLIKYYSSYSLPPQKNQISYGDFMKKYSYNNSDFYDFVKSFKTVEHVKKDKNKIVYLPSDSVNVKIVKDYYNFIAEGDYVKAFSYLINPNDTLERFTLSNSPNQVVKSVNDINGSLVEVLLQSQSSTMYHEVFEVVDGKLNKKTEEIVYEKMSSNDGVETYIAYRYKEGKTVFVLQKNGQEKKEIPFEDDFDTAKLSPKGKYLIYSNRNSDSNYFYDIAKNKLLEGSIYDGQFSGDETAYFLCSAGDAKIYNMSDLSVRFDLLKLYPNLSKYEFSCSTDDDLNPQVFQFNFYNKNNLNVASKIYKFNFKTGQRLN